jgi:hypothetical protein
MGAMRKRQAQVEDGQFELHDQLARLLGAVEDGMSPQEENISIKNYETLKQQYQKQNSQTDKGN